MDVVVLVLVHVRTKVGSRALNLTDTGGVGVGRALLVELLLVLREHVLLVLTDDGGGSGLDVLGLENLVILDGLDTVLVVVDMTLPVDGLDGLGVLLGTDVLLGDFRGDLRADLKVSETT